jgi:hypothetical protein
MKQVELRKHFSYLKSGHLKCKTQRGTIVHPGKIIYGSLNSHGYLQFGFLKRIEKLHRAIYIWHHGPIRGCIDHKNCNKQDNRIENLRDVTRMQNHWNTLKRKTNTSGIKGLSRHKGQWFVKVYANGKSKCFSRNNKKEALRLLYKLRKEMHGNYARN